MSRFEGRKQYPPIFVVKANGTTIEYTDDRAEAHAAFADSSATLKEMFKVEASGSATRIKHTLNGRDVGRRAEPLPVAA